MPDVNADDLWKRFDRAKSDRSNYESELREAYLHGAPSVGGDFGRERLKGERRTRTVFDSRARRAVRDAAATAQANLSSPFQPTVSFRLSPRKERELAASGVLDEAREILLQLDRDFFEAIHMSNYHAAAAPVHRAAEIAGGCLVFNDVSGERFSPSPFDFEAVAPDCVYPEPTSLPTIRTVWRALKLPADEIGERWPIEVLPSDLQKIIESDARKEVEIVDGSYWDRRAQRFTYCVLWKGTAAHVLHSNQQDTSPFIFARRDHVPGETFGYGPLRDMMPDVLTLSKGRELTLKNASLAITGIWQADDDGVINPATIKLIPGTIIPKAVGSSGLTPLQSPGRFDISDLLMGQLGNEVRDAIMARELPVMDKSHVSATAVTRESDRVATLTQPNQIVLFQELQIPVARRGYDILRRAGLTPDISSLGTIGRDIIPFPVGAWVRAAAEAELRRVIAGLRELATVSPAAVQAIAQRPAFIRWFADQAGIPAAVIPSEDVLKEMFSTQESQTQIRDAAETASAAAPAISAAAQLAKLTQGGV